MNRIDPITKTSITDADLEHDLKCIRDHIEAAQDEMTEEVYRELEHKFEQARRDDAQRK